MDRHRNILVVGVLTALLLALSSCSPQVEKRNWDSLVWPMPPEEPKIKLLDIYQTNLDIGASAGALASMFGEEEVVALRKPYGVGTDKEDRIYVTDLGRVLIFDKVNKSLGLIGDGQGMGKLRIPIGVAPTLDGRVYVTDTAADRVFVYDRGGRFLTALGRQGEFEAPSGIAVDEKRQRVYVVDTKKHNVRAYGFNGDPQLTIGERGPVEGKFNYPTNIALDSGGNVYVVDTNNFRVQVFSPEGKFLRMFGKLGDSLGSFSRPKGIAIDSEDHIYVVDSVFNNIQIFDKEGRLLLFWGEAGMGPGQFYSPAGIWIDKSDRIYVVDQLNGRVQIFQYMGEAWKKSQAGKN